MSACVRIDELSGRSEGVLAEGNDRFFPRFLELIPPLHLRGDRPLSDGLLDRARQLPVDVAVDDIALVVHDPVDPEVQIRAVELEEVAEERLELRQLRWGRGWLRRGVPVRSVLDVEGGDHGVYRVGGRRAGVNRRVWSRFMAWILGSDRDMGNRVRRRNRVAGEYERA